MKGEEKMAIQQLTVFVENRRGCLAKITGLLADHQIDMRALSIADTRDFGILRLIVSDTEKALDVLKRENILVQITDVIGVRLSDQPGELSGVLTALDQAEINVEYLYAFLTRSEKNAYVVLRVENNETAAEILRGAGFRMVEKEDLKAL